MIKYYISYFYQVRHMDSHCLPISTALWDPKWFHDNKGPSYIFTDKNGVINGLRAPVLNPKTSECVGCDKQKPHPCVFQQSYLKQLESTVNLTHLLFYISQKFPDKDSIIFLVHEAPNNLCSERLPLIIFFKNHNIELKEWNKE